MTATAPARPTLRDDWRDFPDFDFWIAWSRIAARDAANLPCPAYGSMTFADAAFRQPGFTIAAHLGEDVLAGYLMLMLKEPGKPREELERLAQWLLETYEQSHQVPREWDAGGWSAIV